MELVQQTPERLCEIKGNARMSDPNERSESGGPVYRHAPRNKPFKLAIGDGEQIAAINAHIEKHVGKPDSVFHEIISDLVHIDVHIVKPAPKRNFYTLITSGMSDLPMHVPPGCAEQRYAELMICLPPTWNLGSKYQTTEDGALKDERNYWPIRWLKALARMVHEYDTWLGPGHTVPTGDPPRPYAPNTKLCCLMTMPPATTGKDFCKLGLPDRVIHFMALWPLYEEEMNLKLKKGSDALLDRIERFGFEKFEVVDIRRPSLCKKRFWLL
jgi:hypothetical protein